MEEFKAEHQSGPGRPSRAFRVPIASVVLAIALFCGTLLDAAQANPAEVPAMALPAKERKQIEKMLTAELQSIVNRQKRIAGQGKYVTVKVTLGTRDRSLQIHLSKSYVPKYNGAEFEDLEHELATTALELLRGIVSVDGVEFLFDGKDIYYYIPEVTPHAPRRRVGTLSEAPKTVAVAGGHGLYYHYGFNDWRPQRDPSNGVTEDFITPYFVSDLKSLLTARSSVAVGNPRSTSTVAHSPSGQAWWKVSARYFLQGIYPNNPEIWHSLPAATDNLRERDEDIRSRPLFANHIGANALIHVHTNAGDPSARGARVFYQQGRAADAQLGSSILCYMKEQIQAIPAYASFPLPLAPQYGDYGETRLAAMPSVIVEVGFHTNPMDAAALQDARFRGPQCEGLKRYYFKGYPKFPVTLKTVNVSCPSGWTCSNKSRNYASATASQVTYDFYCTAQAGTPAATFKWRTTLTDADGVVTASVDHATTCSPG